MAEKPFPGSSRDCEELACRVRSEFFKNMEMVGISLRKDSYAFSLTPPRPKVSLGV